MVSGSRAFGHHPPSEPGSNRPGVVTYHLAMKSSLTPAKEASRARRLAWVNSYTARTTVLLSALALVYLATFSIQSIWWYPGKRWFVWMSMFGYLLWVLFAADLLLRFIVTPAKRGFFRKNWLDTITVVIPSLRALRSLNAFTANGVLSKRTGLVSGGAVATAALSTVLIVWIGSLMVLNAERGAPNAEIKTLGDALWWCMVTITTVGYGDFVPVTAMGRCIAVLIMMTGISVLGVVSASMAAGLVKRTKAPASDPATEVMQELAELKAMVKALQDQLNAGAVKPSDTA